MTRSARSAILVGQLIINVPILALMAAGFFAARSFDLRGSIGVLIGAGVGWIYWSLAVPRWREWALRQGADAEELQRLGVATGLLWKKGSPFEKTELPRQRRD